MKKDEAELPKEHNDQKPDESCKRGRARAPQRTGNGLTCNEAQVEALLSESEST